MHNSYSPNQNKFKEIVLFLISTLSLAAADADSLFKYVSSIIIYSWIYPRQSYEAGIIALREEFTNVKQLFRQRFDICSNKMLMK
jgi:hypothetical protein